VAESLAAPSGVVTEIVLYHHTGLGDHFICNGLVNDFAERHAHLYLPCNRIHEATVACLYSEQPKVTVVPVDNDRQHAEVAAFAAARRLPIVKVGFAHCVPEAFDRSFYAQLQIPFEYRYTKFRLPSRIAHEDEVFDALAPRVPYAVVHREASFGTYRLRITTPLPIVEITRFARRDFGNLLNYRKLLQRAAEIHCINSSVIHLASSIETSGALFYHDVRKKNFQLAPGWTIVPYRARELRERIARVRRLFEHRSTV
jgi:hypothetical protein